MIPSCRSIHIVSTRSFQSREVTEILAGDNCSAAATRSFSMDWQHLGVLRKAELWFALLMGFRSNGENMEVGIKVNADIEDSLPLATPGSSGFNLSSRSAQIVQNRDEMNFGGIETKYQIVFQILKIGSKFEPGTIHVAEGSNEKLFLRKVCYKKGAVEATRNIHANRIRKASVFEVRRIVTLLDYEHVNFISILQHASSHECSKAVRLLRKKFEVGDLKERRTLRGSGNQILCFRNTSCQISAHATMGCRKTAQIPLPLKIPVPFCVEYHFDSKINLSWSDNTTMVVYVDLKSGIESYAIEKDTEGFQVF